MATAYKPINGGGIQLRPFNTHKRWVVTDINQRSDSRLISVIKGISPNFGEKINVSESISLPAYRETDQLDNSQSNSTDFLKSKHQKVVWASLNQMFFKHRARTERDLFATASIFSIPHNRLGDGIRPGTIEVVDTSVTSSTLTNITLKDVKLDEYHGKLIDTTIPTGSYVPFGNLIGYWGFNDEVTDREAAFDKIIEDRSGYINNGVGKNLKYVDGIKTTGPSQLPSGKMVELNGSDSYVLIDNKPNYKFFETNNYSVSVWTVLPTSQSDASGTHNAIVSKRGTQKDYGTTNKGEHVLRRRNIGSSKFPFDLEVFNQTAGANNGKVRISLSNGITRILTSSTTKINDNEPHHICFNKTGSHMELWIDGVKEATGSLPTSGSIDNITMRGISNSYDILLGSRFISDGGFDKFSDFASLSGSLDEFRMYNKGLTESEIKGLANNDYVTGSAYQTDTVGEVFYNHGVMVVSDPRPKYRYVWTGQSGTWNYGSEVLNENDDVPNSSEYGWLTKYKSTKQLHELNVLCEVGSNEFNVSQNPTLKLNNDSESPIMKGMVTGSDFRNYFTTLGLYNPNGDLIAVGKLASAIQNRSDVDITVKVRMDMDGPFGAPGTGSLMSGNTATVTEVQSIKENGELTSKYIWGKLDRPDILVGGDFGEAYEPPIDGNATMESPDVLPHGDLPPDDNNDPLPTSPVGGINGSYKPPR